MAKKVQVVQVVDDPALKRQAGRATAAFRRYFPGAPPLELYRTSEGQLGFQARISVAPGERERLEKAYAAVMRALGQGRGRPPGERKVQAKLRLREPVYRALRAAAQRSHTTLSGLVEDLAERARLV